MRVAQKRAIDLLPLITVLLQNLEVNAAEPEQSTVAGKTKERQDATSVKARESWLKAMQRLPRPPEGCYASSFPNVEWKTIPCGTPPAYPPVPSMRIGSPFLVGGGTNDYAANVTGTISAVEGTFPGAPATLTESGPVANSGPSFSDTYMLQINSNRFSGSACAGSPNPNCQGWQQFVYENSTEPGKAQQRVYIAYWLYNYNASCPSGGWQFFQFGGDPNSHCWQPTLTASLLAGIPVSKLGSVVFSAAASASGDQVTISDGTNIVTKTGVNALGLAAVWTDAEFNIVGDGGNSSGGAQASFGANTTLVVKTTVHNGTRNKPSSRLESFEAETNNLTLVGTPALATQPAPSIEFTQSNVPGSPAACQAAAGVGETHLTTFAGLLYDFQAAGDFILAETGRDFVVQTRQVSAAPSWPNASMNRAIGVRMGEARIAFCADPATVKIDGKVVEIDEGKPARFSGGIEVLRNGSAYVVAELLGNSVRAAINAKYIDVSVGLCRWPSPARGLLANANANNNVNQLETRTGVVLSNPFSFKTLYHAYADSWRVPAKDLVLIDCGDATAVTPPTKAFYANDLPREVLRRALAVCAAAGIKNDALFGACALDVAVLGSKDAANVFVNARTPLAVGKLKGAADGKYHQR